MIIGDSESLEKPKDLATGTVWLVLLLGKSDAWTVLHKIGSAVPDSCDNALEVRRQTGAGEVRIEQYLSLSSLNLCGLPYKGKGLRLRDRRMLLRMWPGTE